LVFGIWHLALGNLLKLAVNLRIINIIALLKRNGCLFIMSFYSLAIKAIQN